MTKIQKQKKINQIKKNIKSYKPKKVILFGSYAWGKPTKNSDIDLLIIKNTKQNQFKRIPEARSYLYDVDSAFDILVMTPTEIKKRLTLGDFFIKNILNKGKVLYEEKR